MVTARLQQFFDMRARGTGIRREILAGVTTFLTMAYIMFVNPKILSAAGLDEGAVFVATCLAAAFATAIMALYANLPIALAPGMGLNAYFAFVVVPALGGDWRLALGAVFLSGMAFLVISLTPAREWLINAIPKSLKLAIAAGIGFFLALIGFENAGFVKASQATLIEAGNFAAPPLWIAAGAFLLIAALTARKVSGAVLIGILSATFVAHIFGLNTIAGLMAPPPSLAPTFLQMDVIGALQLSPLVIVFVFLMVDMLDTSGTLTAVAHQGKFLDPQGRLPNARRALVADAAATMIGAGLGTSTTTSYIESAAGVQAGGRTGLTSLTVAVLFVASLFFAPLAASVPAYAAAPALIFVAALMSKGLADIDWDDVTEAAPALITALAIPLTFSIATGIGLGFVTYAGVKLLAGRAREVNAAVAVIAVLFLAKLAVS